MEYNAQQKLNKWRDFACGEMERNNRMGEELATLRAENERLREALVNLLKLAKMHAPNAGFPQAEEALK